MWREREWHSFARFPWFVMYYFAPIPGLQKKKKNTLEYKRDWKCKSYLKIKIFGNVTKTYKWKWAVQSALVAEQLLVPFPLAASKRKSIPNFLIISAMKRSWSYIDCSIHLPPGHEKCLCLRSCSWTKSHVTF